MPASVDRLHDALSGHYAIEREIGAGGMALVYLAEDLKHRRRVAIKVLKPELAATLGADRFLREIEIAARLSHPHILPLFDSGAAGDLLYYVMPFVAGESLRARLIRERQLAVDDALRLTREIASALGFAHQQGIVHRDIKPENILLADGIALVADFGIARALRSSRATGDAPSPTLTMAGLAIGTPAYMSPEQFTAEEVDGRSDIYSLGCVMFEMLAGQPPFGGSTMDALLRQHLMTEPRPLGELRPTVPIGIARIVARALAKDPADRFPAAAAMAEAIATVVSGGFTPVQADTGIDTPNNLPKQRTRFIGRDRELAECARLFGETRLLTLTGIGGSGKTRLALRLAESLLPSFPDGVWMVDFAPLVDAQRVPATVAAALGVAESADKPLMTVVTEKLKGTRTLMVLDNCEHLLGAAVDIANQMLAADAGVRLLATSREGLGIDGERLVALQSMSVPPKTNVDPRLVADADAVRLFVDRAQAARRDFVLGPDNAAAVAEICRRLDGIPLAIELAAARVKALSVEQIRSKLDDRFRLLTGGRSAVPRQQTLLATIQWSYEQLTSEEQRLLRQLSVFSGGWTLESATAVAGDGDEFAVLDILTRLIDKSLVLVDAGGSSEARYTMLESVRQFGSERLVESGESDAARDRHLAYFMQLGEQSYREKFTREAYWGERLTTEHDNLRAAVAFARDRDSERYLTFVGAIGYFLWARSHILEARQYFNDALGMASPTPVRRSYARALRGQAMFVAASGDSAQARRLTELNLSMWRELGDIVETGHSLATLGWSQFFGGEDEDAYLTFEELLRVSRQVGDAVYVNQAKVALGQVLVALARVEEARQMANAVLDFSRKAGDKRAEHSGWHYLADCALLEGDCRAALGLYRQSLVLAEAIGDRVETSFEVEGIAMALAGLGDGETAVRLTAATRAEWARHGVELNIRFWEALVKRYMDPARATLGTRRTEAAVIAGRAMTLEDSVREAHAAANRHMAAQNSR